MPDESAGSLVEIWRNIQSGARKTWVLFNHGTCVTVPDSTVEPEAEAKALLKEWGPVVVGTPAGDFNVFKVENDPGWVVTCHHPDIATYVGPDDFSGGTAPADIFIGLTGRGKRDQDASELDVIHVER